MQPQNPIAKQPIREMVGATRAPFFVGPGGTNVELEIHPPTGPAAADKRPGDGRTYLKFENITCEKRAPSLRVYLNLPPNEVPERHPELRAGSLGLFGIDDASRPDGQHGGHGMTIQLDITNLFRELSKNSRWNGHHLIITFDPAQWDAPVPQVSISRVSMYLER